MKLQLTLRHWAKRLFGKSGSQEEPLRRFLAKAISGTFGFKIISMALVYLNSLLLVRLVGVRGYGEYVYVIAWLQILLIPSALGFEGLISRELAVYTAKERWQEAKGLLDFSNRVILFNSICLAVVAGITFWLVNPTNSISTLITLSIGLVSLPFLALSRIREASLQAIKVVVIGQLPEAIIRPAIIFVTLSGLFLLRQQVMPSSVAMSIDLAATAIAFGTGAYLLRQKLSEDVHVATANYSRKLWLKSAAPMLLIGGMYVINGQTDSVMLGILKDAESVGIYTVANRGAGLVSFVQLAFSTSLAPVFATLYAQGNLPKLKSTIKKSCQATFFISVLLAAVLAIFSHWFLLIFGPEFLTGQRSLFILMGGQLVNAFTGATARLLIMTGYDKDTATGVTISAFANIVLNALLIPAYGIEGAAIATALSMILWNVILVGFTYRRFGVLSTAIQPFW